MTEDDDPMGEMLQIYPELKQVDKMPQSKQLFLAGYLAHLLYDQIWFMNIIIPHFWKNSSLGKGKHRRLVHLLLLSAYDLDAIAQLPASASSNLTHAVPDDWLPFGTDDALSQWRDMITAQLRPDGEVRTLEIFAKRAELDVETFSSYFYNEAWMNQNVHASVSPEKYNFLKANTCTASIQLITTYLLTTVSSNLI